MADPRRSLGEGAAQEAPTAPHATPRRTEGKRTGPEWFWSRWPVRIALGLSLIVSGAAHCAVMPFDVPLQLDLKDREGEAAIPVDVFESDEVPTVEPPPPEPPSVAREGSQDGRPDGGGGMRDGSTDAARDAPPDVREDAKVDAGPEPDGAVASVDAGPSNRGPADPQAVLGAAGDIQADVVLVYLIINAEEIKKNPEAPKLGKLLTAVPQWHDFMDGTDVDPVRDMDWLMISGPALVHTEEDVVLIHYSAPDAVVDKAIAVVSAKYRGPAGPIGGPIDAGVPGVKASLAHADRAQRVLIRPQPHVLAVVPPKDWKGRDMVERTARQLAPPAKVRARLKAGEAFYMRVVKPHNALGLIPESITEMRMVIKTRPDDGVDIFIEGDTRDPEAAAQAAEALKKVLADVPIIVAGPLGAMAFPSMTGHILEDVDVTSEGKLVKLHRTASRGQIDKIVSLVAVRFNIDLDAPIVAPASPATAPSSAPAK